MSADTKHPLADHLIGHVVGPGERGYTQGRRLFNRAIDKKPAGIAYCWGSSDVIAAVNFAREERQRLSVRSGGCCIAGYSMNDDGLVIDLSGMKGAIIDPVARTVLVEPGVVWAELYPQLAPSGMIIPGGECPMVAVGGLTLGGGLSLLGRSMGLTCDSLRHVHVVTADGELRVADSKTNPDLFWALRGGGSSFGVVTALGFDLQPLPQRLVTGYIEWPIEDAVEIGVKLQHYFYEKADDRLGGLFLFTPKKDGARSFGTVLVYDGPVKKGEAAMEAVAGLGKTTTQQIAPMSYFDFVHASFQAPRQKFYEFWKSSFIAEPLPAEALRKVADALEHAESDGDFVGFELVGGAVNEIDWDATAFCHRDQFCCFSIFANSPEGQPRNRSWAQDLYDDLGPWLSGYHYQNYPDPTVTDWPTQYYGANYPRLQKIKAKYDPGDLFHHRQSIRLPDRSA